MSTFPNQDRRKKLSREEVRTIRHWWDQGWTARDLAAYFQVSAEHVGLIVKGLRRREVSHG